MLHFFKKLFCLHGFEHEDMCEIGEDLDEAYE
jgi:hypothetical protein